MNRSVSIVIVLLFMGLYSLRAHEPLFGIGPHVLFKNGFAPHFTILWNSNVTESEYALGYGLTKNWTTIVETPFQMESKKYQWNSVNFKNKYRFWMKAKQGSLGQLSAFSAVSIPRDKNQPKLFNFALTGGQETLTYFWFASTGYTLKFTDKDFESGDQLLYNLTIGYRPIKASYFKPDIVLFLETLGDVHQKSRLNEKTIRKSGGHNFSIAPSFFLTYRNIALRGGVKWNIFNSRYLSKNKTSYKLTLEMHL